MLLTSGYGDAVSKISNEIENKIVYNTEWMFVFHIRIVLECSDT